jgi:ABC-type Na+ efflux pump permease subunit
MNKTTLIFRHEFLQEIKKPGYLLMTLMVPLLALVAIGVFRLVIPTPAPAAETVQALPQPTEGYVGDPNMANILVPAVFALLLGLSLMLGATSLINGLGEEKESRLIQVLFSSVSVRQLLVGKVLALGTAGLLQVSVWLLSTPLLLGLASAWFGGFMSRVQVPGNFVLLGIVYFCLGYLLFAVLSIGVGAISSGAKEANTLALFYTLGSFTPLWLSSLNMFFPNSWIWAALTIFPVTGPIMTMLRLGTSVVPTWQIAASIGALALSIVGGLFLSIRLFRVHMLMYGKRPSLAQIASSLREARPAPRKTARARGKTAGTVARLVYVDYWRVGLAILVVLHHVALVYGASVQGFYYIEPPFSAPGVVNPVAYLALLVFVLLNQAWFMGAFFLLAGYFVPGSYDRRGPGSFLTSKLVRLGIPLVLFAFVLNPISRLGWWLMPPALTGITTPVTWQAYPRMVGLGPLWFVALLLVFGLGYTAWRLLVGRRTDSSPNQPSAPSYLGIGVFVLALAGASYLIRTQIPIGKSVWEFPTLAYLPQYLGFYVIGTVAYRRNWFRTLPRSMGAVGLVSALVAGAVLFPLAFSGRAFSLELTQELGAAWGNGHWRSAVYALFDSVFSVGLCLGAIAVFRGLFRKEGQIGRFLCQQSYAVYVLHIPVIVFLAYALRGLQLAPLAKFGVASLIAVPASFALSALVRQIPGVSRVL